MTRITSRENEGIKLLAKLLASNKERRASGLFVIEGNRLIYDALKSNVEVKALYLSESWDAKNPQAREKFEGVCACLNIVSDDLMQKLSDTKTPQGLLALCEGTILKNELPDNLSKGALMLCSLQDPGNLGTIIRTADAFDLSAVILADQCPSITAPKVLRASMGSAFRIPIVEFETMNEAKDKLYAKGIKVLGASLGKDSVPINEVNLKNCCIAIGNEGAGLTESQVGCCDQQVILPINPKCESLNAAMAAGIFAWEINKAVR